MTNMATTMTATTTGRTSSVEREPGLDRSDIPAPLPGRPLWVIFGSILVLAGLTFGTLNIISLLAHEERTESFTVAARGITTLDVRNESGSVRVTGTDSDEISVVAEISRGLRDTGVSHEVVGTTLELRGTCPVIGSEWCAVTYRIEVPNRLDVVVTADNDSVTVVDIEGNVRVDTDNGRTELTSISGSVVVEADNGRVEGRDLSSDTVDVAADNGLIDLEFYAPPRSLTANADNGSIDIALPVTEAGYDIETSTDNGGEKILVADDPESPNSVRAQTENGSITIRPID